MTLRVPVGVCAVTLALIVLCSLQTAAEAELPQHFDSRTMIPVAEVKPGMKGTAKTVFRGVEITEFSIEVIGVLPKFDLGGDLVLIRALDGPLIERGSGVVGGMSGSPVYLDGRLLGAIAYSWTFEKEPIGGVTPMESMLSAYVEKPEEGEEKTSAIERPPVMLHGRRLTSARLAGPDDAPFADLHTINMAPVGLLSCSGLSRQCLAHVSEFFEPYGLQPVAGPGALDEPVEAELVSGAAVSVELMRGDFSSSLIGTVTHRDGESLLAFGHPFMQLGAVDMPIATAYIHDFIPSYARSDKMGSAMEMVGSLRVDGGWSVGGLLGPVADMVPVAISVSDETTGRRRTFEVEVARDKNITQQLVSMAVANSVDAGFRPMGEGTARVRFAVEGERGARVERENVYWDRYSIAAACTGEVASTIYVLRRNPFDPQEPARVEMDISVSDENTSAAIEEVYTDETVAKAGEKLTVHVVLRPWDGKPFEKVVELDMPEDLSRGTMRIGVCGGEGAYTMRSRLQLLQRDFHDLPSIIKDIQETELNDQLFVGAALPNTSVGVAQYLLHRLPSSVTSILSASRTTDVRGGKEEVSELVDSDRVILGQDFLTLATEDKTGARATTPPPSAPKTAPPTSSSPERTAAGTAPARSQRINPMTAPPADWAESMVTRARPAEQPAGGLLPAASEEKPRSASPARKVKAKSEAPSSPPVSTDEEEEDEGALTRSLSEWRQETEEHFKEGEAEGVAIRSDGALYVAVQKGPSWQTQEHRGVWSIAAPDGQPIYFGTGKDGRIYKAQEGTEPELVCETGELAVHALAFSGGQLYAGTIPEGKLFKIDPASPDVGEPVADLTDDYIWALVPDGNGGVYAGTGSDARIYHVMPDGTADLVADLPAQHVLCMTAYADDLLAGTAEGGVVYRVTKGGKFEAIYDDEAPAVSGVAVTASGEVYACTSDKGHVVRITPGKKPLTVLELEKQAATAMVALGDATYVGTDDDGKVLAVLGPEQHAVVAEVEASEVSCLAVAGDRVLAGAANPGRLETYDTAAASSGTFESAVLDTERVARWGSLLWTGEVPDGASVEVKLRVGSTADPDDGTWNAWSYSYPLSKLAQVLAPAARFIQYQVRMAKGAGGQSPLFESFLLKYLPANQKPEVKLKAPLTGAAISGECKIEWEGSDPDDDTLRYAVYYRAEGSQEWKRLEEQLEEQEYEWDTSSDEVGEGIVAVRVVGTDALSNPGDPLEKESVAYPVTIDNTPPELWQEGEPEAAEDRTVEIKGTASDSASPIVSVEYRVGEEGKWQTARPTDGLFDGLIEKFRIHTSALDPGQQVITVRLRDAAGNKHDAALSAVVPGEEEDAKDQEGSEDEGKKEAPEAEKQE
jgi:hypothetical protein